MKEINWDTLLLKVDLPDFGDILDNEPEQVIEPLSQPCSIQNPDEESIVSSWIEEIENVLMKDDNFDHRLVHLLIVKGMWLASTMSQTHTDVNKDNPIAKKQKSCMSNLRKRCNGLPEELKLNLATSRNKDATVRSRERKKMYVKDLDMKSKYLEGECRRLSHVFRCFIAENQALQILFSSSSL
ncbi:hypothetical protein CXB51_020470 [Gossypium anomalum]|uniref:BZIP domain-containing protein n=1 Tax=Gossypium anomalum TaxID=47600 RepID=A0A8J6CYI7_9ROSI|nr:hypothetical protein CXB51_020470 [Gossypium anomalum]